MPIGGWVIAIFVILTIAVLAMYAFCYCNNAFQRIAVCCVAVVCAAGVIFGLRWFYQNTASGQRAMTDQKSNLSNGMERTITVYTADGKVIAQYRGKIDIEGNDGGYVLFDYEGKRYTYYNCFVESIAEIE